MYGVAQGRNRLPDAVLIFSEEAHYCLHKIAHLLKLPVRIVGSHTDGNLDLESLESTIRSLQGRPFILNLTVGTTFHGAIETPEKVIALLERMPCGEHHLHVDAALYGPMLTWIEGSPLFDFRLPIQTLSFSGHKFLGAPIPCGIHLSYREAIQAFDGSAEYVGSLDTTLSGSRDGIAAVVLWLLIQRLGPRGMTELAEESLELADRFAGSLNDAGEEVIHHEGSCVVAFRKPPEAITRRWHLATRGDCAHVVTVPGVTSEMLATFLEEWQQEESRLSPDPRTGGAGGFDHSIRRAKR